MDEADRQKPQDDVLYTANLEKLVKARTDQLLEVVSQNEQLLTLLKQIQSMKSLEDVREAARSGIKKFTPEPMPAPKFGGEAGEPVPEVDPDDLKAIWKITEEAQAGPNIGRAIGADAMKQVCKPEANVEATFYRSGFIWMLRQLAPEQLSPWLTEGQVADSVFRAMASIPMEWIGSGVRQGFPFDTEEFFRRLSEQRPA